MGDGVTVETNVHGRYLGDERFEPVWQELDRRAAAVFVHPTSPPAADAVANGRPLPMLEFIFDATRAATGLVFTGVLTRYPDIQWVFTHDRHRRAHGRGRLPQGAGEGQPGRSRHTRRHRRGHPGLDTGQRGPLLFAAAHRFLLELTETSDVKVVILRMSRISVIDSSGARVLEDAIDRLTKRGVLVLVRACGRSIIGRWPRSGRLMCSGRRGTCWPRHRRLSSSRTVSCPAPGSSPLPRLVAWMQLPGESSGLSQTAKRAGSASRRLRALRPGSSRSARRRPSPRGC